MAGAVTQINSLLTQFQQANTTIVAGVQSGAVVSRAEDQREAWRDGYIRRLFRVITEDVESLSREAGET